MKYPAMALALAVSFVGISVAQARSGFVKTADGICHYCDTTKQPMCFPLQNDALCKKYGQKTFGAKLTGLTEVSPGKPVGEQPAKGNIKPNLLVPSPD